MTTLTEFLLARIAEDERYARGELCDRYDRDVDQDRADRVLADCAAKRRIVELHTALDVEIRATFLSDPDTAGNARLTRIGTEFALLCLASPYADHPDYNEAWRP